MVRPASPMLPKVAIATVAVLTLPLLLGSSGDDHSFAVPQAARATARHARTKPMAGKLPRQVMTIGQPQQKAEQPPSHWLLLLGMSGFWPAMCVGFFKYTHLLNHALEFAGPGAHVAVYVGLASFFWSMARLQLFSRSARAVVQVICNTLRRFKFSEWKIEVFGKLADPLANLTQGCLVFLAFNLLVNAIPENAVLALPRILTFMDVNHSGFLEAAQLEQMAYSVASRLLFAWAAWQAAAFVRMAKEPPTEPMEEPDAMFARFKFGQQKLVIHKDMTYVQSQEALIVQFFDKAISVGSWAGLVAFFAALCNLKMSYLLAIGGVGGLAFSLAAQNVIQNLISGFLIFANREYIVGDEIATLDGSVAGIVDSINATNTVIHRLDGEPVTVPNSNLVNSAIINVQRRDYYCIEKDFPLMCSSFVDLKKVVDKMQDVLAEKVAPYKTAHVPTHRGVFCEPIVWFEGFGDQGAVVKVKCYVDGALDGNDFYRLQSDTLMEVSNAALSFDGVNIGFEASTVAGGDKPETA